MRTIMAVIFVALATLTFAGGLISATLHNIEHRQAQIDRVIQGLEPTK